MGHNIPAGSIPRRSVLPPGNHTLEINTLEETDVDGLYAIRGAYTSLWPVAGLTHSELFVLGTEADPNADDPESWSGQGAWSAQRMFRMLDKAKVPGSEAESVDSEQLCADAEGHRFDVVCTHVVDDGKKRPENKGKTYVRLNYFEEGVLQATGGGGSAPKGAAPRAPAAARPQAPARPVPAAAPTRAPVRAATPAPVPPAETEYEAPAEEAPAAAAPPARAAARPIPRRA